MDKIQALKDDVQRQMKDVKIHVETDCEDPGCTKDHVFDCTADDLAPHIVDAQDQEHLKSELLGIHPAKLILSTIYHARHSYRIKNRDEVNAKLDKIHEIWTKFDEDLEKLEKEQGKDVIGMQRPVAEA